jgi:hypothetical protein
MTAPQAGAPIVEGGRPSGIQVHPATPRQSYRLCEWRACRTYATWALYRGNDQEHLSCPGHLQDMVEWLTWCDTIEPA